MLTQLRINQVWLWKTKLLKTLLRQQCFIESIFNIIELKTQFKLDYRSWNFLNQVIRLDWIQQHDELTFAFNLIYGTFDSDKYTHTH
jgi:hypothetical protein